MRSWPCCWRAEPAELQTITSISLFSRICSFSIELSRRGKKTALQMMFSSVAEVLLSHLARFHSAARKNSFFFPFFKCSRENSAVDKHHMKMGPGDEAAFPVSRPRTAGDPWSSCLTNPEAPSPDSPAIHYRDVRRAHQTTSGALWCHISGT